MQDQESQGTKVVSIFSKKTGKEETKKKSSESVDSQESKDKLASSPQETPPGFNDVMKQNQLNKERLEKERASANKSVLRSYRIKH
jgi:hypothetical protein